MSNSYLATQVKRRAQSTAKKLEELRGEMDHLIDAANGVTAALSGAQEKISLSNYPGLNFTSIRDALCTLNEHRSQDWIPSVLATCGSGPWDAEEFDNFLRTREIGIHEMPHEGIKCLVLGISGWDENDLSAQIYNRVPSSLRIYTQELFVLGLIAGRDPYEFIEQAAIDQVGLEHPAIQFILNKDFAWPWTEQPVEDESSEEWEVDDGDWANESILHQMGYSVRARGGPDSANRRLILRKTFESDHLLGIDTLEQRQRWGARKSPRRLHAISHFIGWLINLQGSEKPAAREKWVSDLKWLKQEFYAKTMSFTWPAVAANPTVTTTLRPEAAWPFATQQPVEPIARSSNSNLRNFLKPRHALAIIIGPEPRSSTESAVEALRNYIDDKKLRNIYSGRITSDDRLFALAGSQFLKDSDLPGLVEKNLRS